MPVPAVMTGGMPTVSSGIGDHHLRHHLRMEDDLLRVRRSSVTTPARPTSEPVPAVVGTATIGAIRLGVGARPPVADILEIPDRPLLPGHEGDELADIEPAAAAEGDDAVMPAGLEDVRRRAVRLVSTGLGCTSEKMPGVSPPFAHDVERARGDVELREARIGDEQRLHDARGLAGLGKLGDAARAEADGGRVAPVGDELGHLTVS